MVDGERRTIFSGLSFAIEPGEIVDLVGPSGAGKSSLLTAFARLNPRAPLLRGEIVGGTAIQP